MPHDFVDANEAYEDWLRTQCAVVKKDLDKKHERMRRSPFVFLRATYFRWAAQIETKCPGLAGGPAVLSVGDLHTENYGVWRDADGRLVWGVNDFDEAARMPYLFDLVRLATSASLAEPAPLSDQKIADAILAGYRDGLAKPRPTIVEESGTWMLDFLQCSADSCHKFFAELADYESTVPPTSVAAALENSFPSVAGAVAFSTRSKGGGGLGRPRYVAAAQWRGGTVVREAKAWVPSAWNWVHNTPANATNYLTLARGRFRSPDPVLDLQDNFIIRRIAPDLQKIDLGENPGRKLSERLLNAMGFDLAAIHADDGLGAHVLSYDVSKRPSAWLSDALATMKAAVGVDYSRWAS
jgi:hypothetical protein